MNIYTKKLFFEAIEIGSVNQVESLLRTGISPNIYDEDNSTPLHHSIIDGHDDITKILVNVGAHLNVVDENNETPLHIACKYNESIIPFLLQNGAKVNVKNYSGHTPLHWAAMSGFILGVKVLVNHNASVNAQDNDNKTALHYLEYHSQEQLQHLGRLKESTRVEIIHILLQFHSTSNIF